MRLRHQLAAFSPLSFGDLVRATWARLRAPEQAAERAVRALREIYAAEVVIPCASGTQALSTAIRLAARRMGGRCIVALPAFACFEVGTAAVGSGLEIALYDLDPVSLTPEPDSLERVLARGARIVVVASLYGMPVDWDAITASASRFGAIVIEDAAQGNGAAWRGQPLGSLGQISVVSFGRGKGWTGAGGGALLLRAALARTRVGELAPLRAPPASEAWLGIAALGQWLAGRPSLYGVPRSLPGLGLGETRYHPPSTVRAAAPWLLALLGETRTAAEREAQARRARGAEWERSVPFGRQIQPIRALPAGTPGYLRYPLRLSRGLAGLTPVREALRSGAAYTYPAGLWEVPEVRRCMVRPVSRWPGSACLVRELVTLPTHSRIAAVDRDRLLRLLSAYAGPADHPAEIEDDVCAASLVC